MGDAVSRSISRADAGYIDRCGSCITHVDSDIEPNFTSRFDQSRVFPCDGLHCLEHLSINQNDVEQASYRSAERVTAVQV